MGGNLFKLGRIPREKYLKIEAEIRQYLDKKIGNFYQIPRYYANKPDFGDLDIVINSEAVKHNWEDVRQEIVNDLNIKKYKLVSKISFRILSDLF